jgi:DNA polymerase-3 subunit delta
MTSQEFETAIKKCVIPLVCYLYGEESFLVDRTVRMLLEKALDPSLKDFNYNVFYGNESKGIDIADTAQTLPMLAERRVIWVKRAEGLSAAACEVLLPYIQNPVTTTCMILTGTKIDQRKKFYVELKKHGDVVEFKRVYDNKLSAFIQSESILLGKPIDSSASDLLSFLVGNNLQELSSQLEKLVVFIGNRPRITLEDVRAIASSSKAFTVFELARYLCIKDLYNALKSLDTLFRNGEETPMMIGALSRHFRQLWRVREMLDHKAIKPDIGREVGINPYFLDDIITQAKNFRRDELRNIFSELYRCDLASKTGGGQPYMLIHGLVMGICSVNDRYY